MATNDFLPFANDPAANVISQASYSGLASRVTGFVTGVAFSNRLNKVWRQSSMMAAAIGSMIFDAGGDAIDDGNVTNLKNAIIAAIGAFSGTTGRMAFTISNVADPGWIIVNDGTIGNAASGASTRANADTQALFYMFWNNFPNPLAPVTGGRGASAAADFAANKKIQTGIIAGRIIGATGSGVTAGTLTPRALGDVAGAESIIQAASQVAAHRHLNGIADDESIGSPDTLWVYDATTIDIPGSAAKTITSETQTPTYQGTTSSIVDSASGVPGAPRTGAANPMQIMQPTVFMNLMMKL